jgi:hypothetical protein
MLGGGTTPHIINPVLLHTVPSDNILNLPSHPQHFSNYQIQQLTLSLHILVSLFLWVIIFGQTYQHSQALSGTSVLYECVWSALSYFCFILGENVLSAN